MGLFSTVYNSCPMLGQEFLTDLQTKDLECLLDYYWISPVGELFRMDAYSYFDNLDPKIFKRRSFSKLALRPHYVTRLIRLYCVNNSGFVETYAFFRLGKLIEVIPSQEFDYVSQAKYLELDS
jgi:hypothetical protein